MSDKGQPEKETDLAEVLVNIERRLDRLDSTSGEVGMNLIERIIREEVRKILYGISVENEELTFSLSPNELEAVLIALNKGIDQCIMADTREDARNVWDRLKAKKGK